MILRSFEWHDGELWFHSDSGFTTATLSEASDRLPRQALLCLAARRCRRVHEPSDRESIIIAVGSEADAEWCQENMRGYELRSAIKWSADDPGGSLFFERKGAA